MIENKCGRIEACTISEYKDRSFYVYDENGIRVTNHDEMRKTIRKILNENSRLVKEEFIDMITNKNRFASKSDIERLFNRVGIYLFNEDDSPKTFYEVLEDIMYTFKGVV